MNTVVVTVVWKHVFVILCFIVFSEEKVWTTLKNNLSPQTSVTSADQEGKAVLQITYNVTDEQVYNDHTLSLVSFIFIFSFAFVLMVIG